MLAEQISKMKVFCCERAWSESSPVPKEAHYTCHRAAVLCKCRTAISLACLQLPLHGVYQTTFQTEFLERGGPDSQK